MTDVGGVFEKARAIRESRRVDLEDIARATKIQIRYLRAIELGEIDKLPSGAYRTSFIRQYARALDIDEGELLRVLVKPNDESVRPAPVIKRKASPASSESSWRAFLKRTKRALDWLVAARS